MFFVVVCWRPPACRRWRAAVGSSHRWSSQRSSQPIKGLRWFIACLGPSVAHCGAEASCSSWLVWSEGSRDRLEHRRGGGGGEGGAVQYLYSYVVSFKNHWFLFLIENSRHYFEVVMHWHHCFTPAEHKYSHSSTHQYHVLDEVFLEQVSLQYKYNKIVIWLHIQLVSVLWNRHVVQPRYRYQGIPNLKNWWVHWLHVQLNIAK